MCGHFPYLVCACHVCVCECPPVYVPRTYCAYMSIYDTQIVYFETVRNSHQLPVLQYTLTHKHILHSKTSAFFYQHRIPSFTLLPGNVKHTHIRTHTHTLSHMHTFSCTHTLAHIHMHTHTHSHTHAHTLAQAHTHTHTCSHTYTCTRTHSHTYTYTHTYTCTYTRSHTHTHTPHPDRVYKHRNMIFHHFHPHLILSVCLSVSFLSKVGNPPWISWNRN